jgi:hypothetical protein
MPNTYITPQPKITMLQVSISVLFEKTSTGSILNGSDDDSLHLTLLGLWTSSIMSHLKEKPDVLDLFLFSCGTVAPAGLSLKI